MKIPIHEVARSLELYDLSVRLQEKAKKGERALELVKEPIRERSAVARIIVPFGSFDPLTKGHEFLFTQGMAEASRIPSRRNGIDELVIVTSTNHIEKRVDLRRNSTIYDRVHAQEGFASCHENCSLAFTNDPYFVNIIPLLERKYGDTIDIYFVVGADVMEKVVDAGYYQFGQKQMEDVVDRLFKHRFIVADRTVSYNPQRHQDKLPRHLTPQMIIQENPVLERYNDRVLPIVLPKDILPIPIETLSSSLVRDMRRKGESTALLEASGVTDFLTARELYKESDSYEAFTFTRQFFVDHYRESKTPIANYIEGVMINLSALDANTGARAEFIKKYRSV